MNLEKFSAQKLSVKELKNVKGGGWWITWTAGWGNIASMNRLKGELNGSKIA